jgi:hypothetical protein
VGEYATFRGSSIKIGTCENMYYLRADQRHEVDGYTFGPDVLGVVRFRFPFPQEDSVEPGAFEDYDRGERIPGWRLPAEFDDHGIVQFTATAGYNLCVPCPEQFGHEGFGPVPVELESGGTIGVHRNGFRGSPQVAFQGYRQGHLATIVKCGSCGAMWWLEPARAEEVAVAFRSEADRQECRRGGEWESAHTADTQRQLHTIADRILAGYVLEGAPAA